MKKKQILGLVLFGCAIIMGLYVGIDMIIEKEEQLLSQHHMEQMELSATRIQQNDGILRDELYYDETYGDNLIEVFVDKKEFEKQAYRSIEGSSKNEDEASEILTVLEDGSEDHEADIENQDEDSIKEETINTFANPLECEDFKIELIRDCNAVDYKSYLPEVVMDPKMEAALDIESPSISLQATSALLMNINTGKIIYQKNADKIIFPASTTKLLTSLVVLDLCDLTEEVVVGEEITLIASDSSKARLKQGYKMTIYQLLQAMLIPSGNDAAYTVATYAGRKVLADPEAEPMEAIKEFVRLMNLKAKRLGLTNSCFMTPDGYDAIGQYTTAYDMALVGLAAYKNSTIVEISKMSKARVKLLSGEDVTWNTTNGLVKSDSANYYSRAIGLKTGTSSMAGRCIITVGKGNGNEYMAVVMNSTGAQRFNDAKKLLRYVLE